MRPWRRRGCRCCFWPRGCQARRRKAAGWRPPGAPRRAHPDRLASASALHRHGETTGQGRASHAPHHVKAVQSREPDGVSPDAGRRSDVDQRPATSELVVSIGYRTFRLPKRCADRLGYRSVRPPKIGQLRSPCRSNHFQRKKLFHFYQVKMKVIWMFMTVSKFYMFADKLSQ